MQKYRLGTGHFPYNCYDGAMKTRTCKSNHGKLQMGIEGMGFKLSPAVAG
jgi:hypothetical protein